MSSDFQCEVCENTYSTKSALKKHRTTVKYCSAIIAKNRPVIEEDDSIPDEIENESKSLQCKYCTYSTKIKSNYKRHQEKCKYRPTVTEEDYNEEIIQIQQDKIVELTSLVEKLKEERITISHTYELEIARKSGIIEAYEKLRPTKKGIPRSKTRGDGELPVSKQTILDNIDLFDFDFYKEGVHGIAKFIKQITNDGASYFCSDKNRYVFTRVSDAGIISDKNYDFIIDFINVLRDKALERTQKYLKTIKDEYPWGCGNHEKGEIAREKINELQSLLDSNETTRSSPPFKKRLFAFCKKIAIAMTED